MYLTASKNKPVFGHYENIMAIHNNNPIVNALKDCIPIYAGGYPTALVVGVRKPGKPLELQDDQYKDIDIYFTNKENLEAAKAILFTLDASLQKDTQWA